MNSISDTSGSMRALIIILVFSIVIVAPIGMLGIPDNYDVMEHMRFAVSYSDELADGGLLPDWSSLDNHGFGGAGVRLYPPLTYIILALIKNIGFSWHASVTLTLMLGMLIGCFGVYRFVREFYPAGYPLLAAFIYGVIPYHLYQIYQLFMLGEFMAAAFTPYVFLYGTRLLRNGKINDALWLAVSFSLVLLSHIPSTIILSVALVIYFGLLLTRGVGIRNIALMAFSGALSLSLTSFYWLKVVTEVSWVKHDTKDFYNNGLYTYSVYLFPISLDPPSFYQMKLLWLFDVNIALTLVIFLLLAVIAIIKRKLLDRLGISLLITAAVTLFLTTLPSRPIWDSINLLQKIQFPWRFLSISGVIISLLIAMVISMFRSQKQKPGRALAYSALALAAITGLFIISQIVIPSAAMPGDKFDREVTELTTTLGCSCWWPADAASDAFKNKEPVSAAERSIEIKDWNGTEKNFAVFHGGPVNARVAIFHYPYWKAKINGTEAQLEKADDGTISIPLPQETSEVILFFQEPLFLQIAKYASLVTWLGLIFSLILASTRLT